MNGLVPSDPAERASDLDRVMQLITRATVQFPISQILVPLADTFDLLLDDVATERYWLEEFSSHRDKFGPQWEMVAARALGQGPRQASDQVLKNANYDPLVGIEPWGVELTHAFRATLSELEQCGDEVDEVFSTDKRTRAFVRAIGTQTGKSVLPVLSYVPLQESEWRVIIDGLNDLIELALLFEGAVIVWLIGGFARDAERRLRLRPQLSISPPPSGTRVKPLRVLLGTAYEEQCPSLIPLVRPMSEAQSRRSDSLLTSTPWHRMVVQLDVTVDDYVLMNIDLLSQTERELARQIVQLDRQPRQPHVLRGTVNRVVRPWGGIEPIRESSPTPAVPTRTTVLPPRPPMQAMSYDTDPLEPLPATGGVRQDAEELRRKGMAAVKTDPAVAQRYLLASTMLENISVDVWLTLVEIAKNEKQKESFRREAEKVLRRQHGKT